ncbi:asparagine synthase (glutamine-hydrolyzing) [Maridesulfovibrio hydrothermalis]|uniref:asparagine synthase (glutamine-hydrolyzing) n=1 Tax=Maridesulfovibrio hydrothermalis AM13 = DSM 14728 TaxID=1121451 RepID=L0R917_9BACT|nr:asparagine synthase (glutamine-hydrolyzing) [Maridesulfovibrio hydrothermalis]CCO23249.1 Asparagine synthase (Glutamine-hydrolyzing) [Maridesulfovibrio hydrothermalis AM13 = DSM 14728]
MCAIAGLIDFSHSTGTGQLERIARKMGEAQNHRGPDGHGQWSDPESGIALDHRRLAIIDLTDEGVQPMHSCSRRYVTVFNGEIYNYRELRAKLEQAEGFRGWRGHSDTEVMLEAFEQWGFEKAVKSFNGMFSIALWDRENRQLFLARDRMGEKPLYYSNQGDTFLFGSELKALMAHESFVKNIDRHSLASYLRYHYVPAPRTIFKDVHCLMPGTWIIIQPDGSISEPQQYWSLLDCARDAENKIFTAPDENIIETLEDLLLKVIEREMISDVPLGAFLSGGIDSSLIVALMQQCALSPVKTFTIGFDDEAYNEADDAKAVARHIGTEHTELYVSPKDALDIIPQIPHIWDQPFSDASQIPTHLVSRMTREHVTVALSGDGGDELFAGYNRHIKGASLWHKLKNVPIPLRIIGARSIANISPASWDRVFKMYEPLLPTGLQMRLPGQKLHKLADVMAAESAAEYYKAITSNWQNPEDAVPDREFNSPFQNTDMQPSQNNLTAWMQYMDAATYLPDDILTKVDRAAMAVSLETRAPFLDHEVVEFSQRLPMHLRIQNGHGKHALRQILYKHVPRELIERPKMGFGIPIDSWLRGPLREWAEGLISPNRLELDGFFNIGEIRRIWNEHLSGKKDNQYRIWNILVFQSWLDHWDI